jgi:hypothetical protein
MAVLKTRWTTPIKKGKTEIAKEEEKVTIPVVKEEVIEEVKLPEITEETTVEEIIATLPKKQRARKTVVKTEE